MSSHELFTNSEWNKFQLAPFWVFLLVAGIDGKVDKKEMTEIANQINQMNKTTSGFSKEVFSSIVGNIENVMGSFANLTGKDAIEGLSEVNILLKKVDERDSDDFKKRLIYIGAQVAESSGGLFKKNISDDEKKALVAIYAILDMKV